MLRNIAHHLSTRGIAVLHMDDRGTRQNTGRYEYATTADYMQHISVPFLAINGEKDAMVNAQLNLGTARKLMEHNPHFQPLLLPGLNHLLLPCEKGTPDEYRSIKAPLSGEVLKAVGEFILNHTPNCTD